MNNILEMNKFREILCDSVYRNYDNIIALATEISAQCDYLVYQSYNPVTKTIEFKIKKTNTKKLQQFTNLPDTYYSFISTIFSKMIQNWRTQITTYILQKTGSIHSLEYTEMIELLNKISIEHSSSFMLLFNITTTSTNGILLQL